MTDRDKGEAICADLKRYGLKPVWLDVRDPAWIAIGIEFVSGVPNWVRAFRYDAAHATPQAFVGLVNEWKNSVRRQIVRNDCSVVVAKAIEAFGIMAVLDAMEDTRLEAVN